MTFLQECAEKIFGQNYNLVPDWRIAEYFFVAGNFDIKKLDSDLSVAEKLGRKVIAEIVLYTKFPKNEKVMQNIIIKRALELGSEFFPELIGKSAELTYEALEKCDREEKV